MKKANLFISTALLMVSASTFAGGILTNTNQHIAFLRNPARDASLEIDAVYSNPAGLAFLKDGFHLSLNIQSAYQTRTIRSTFGMFKYQGYQDGTKEYEGKASAPIIPSFQAAYKKGDWTISGGFAITGGGGKATFDDGLGSFDSQVMALIYKQTAAAYGPENAITPDKYEINSAMTGKQFIYGAQLGATYKISEHWAAYAGFRMNYVFDSYSGYLYADMPNESSTPTSLAKLELDCDQTGWGLTPIIGVDFKYGKLNIGAKMEFNTNLNVENETNKCEDMNTGILKKAYGDGVNTPHDIPAMFAIGASYELMPSLRISGGFHYFFDKDAKMADLLDLETGETTGRQKYLSHGTLEYLGGIEYDLNKMIQVSAGIQSTNYGITDKYMTDLSFVTSSYSIGFGAGINLSEDMKLNIAYFWTNYDKYTKESENYNGTTLAGKDVFTRTNKVFGVGLNYRF